MKKYLRIILYSCLILLITFFVTFYDYQKYATITSDFTKSIINEIVKKYPDVEVNDIILLLNQENFSSSDVLNNYGFKKDDIEILQANKKAYQENLIRNFSIAIILIVLITIIYLINNKKKTQELEKIINYLKDINSGNYNLEINDNSEGLISILKNEIYTTTIMLREKALEEEQDKINLKDSLSNISHQLKTPLTSILLLVDNLYDGELDKKTQKEFLNDIRLQTENINFLIITMLKLSRFDANVIEFNKTKINVKEILIDVLKNLDIIRELKNINIHLSGANNIYFNGDYKWELEALSNIVKNCIEHTPSEKNIYINYEENNFYTKIVIMDEGPGITNEEKKNIFKRFYKGKNSSATNFGIGLSLAKEIIKEDNGTIKVETEVSKFTKFIIKYYK